MTFHRVDEFEADGVGTRLYYDSVAGEWVSDALTGDNAVIFIGNGNYSGTQVEDALASANIHFAAIEKLVPVSSL